MCGVCVCQHMCMCECALAPLAIPVAGMPLSEGWPTLSAATWLKKTVTLAFKGREEEGPL